MDALNALLKRFNVWVASTALTLILLQDMSVFTVTFRKVVMCWCRH